MELLSGKQTRTNQLPITMPLSQQVAWLSINEAAQERS
jgi:hypothetical protein